MRALFAWCKFMIVFIPVTDLVIVMQINYYYYYYSSVVPINMASVWVAVTVQDGRNKQPTVLLFRSTPFPEISIQLIRVVGPCGSSCCTQWPEKMFERGIKPISIFPFYSWPPGHRKATLSLKTTGVWEQYDPSVGRSLSRQTIPTAANLHVIVY